MIVSFEKVTCWAAYLAGVSWLLYAYYFVVVKDPLPLNLFLMLGGLFAVKVFAGLYFRLRDQGEGFALLALLFGVVGSFGVLIHGGYDLANVINPPTGVNPTLPSQVDPRGLLTFGATGLAVLKFSALMKRAGKAWQNLSLLGFVSGILLLVIYFGRLTVLDPTSPILRYSILLEGFIVNPLWYLWLGWVLSKK